MTPTEAEGEEVAFELWRWARAYRDGPREHRFPSDPDCEFFPPVLERGAEIIASLTRQLAEARAERERMVWALQVFSVHSTYPVAAEIDPRGYRWRGEDHLDYAKELADVALSPPREDAPAAAMGTEK